MKSAKKLPIPENKIIEPDFTQGDADAKPPIALQKEKSLSFLTLDDIPEVFSSHWLVKGIIPLTGIGIIYGEYASGKTFFVIDLAMAIASGKDFFGCKVKQTPVLYFCLEGKEGFINRLAAWKKEHKTEICQLDFKFNTSGFDFFKIPTEEIAKFPKNSVIIIDTLNATDPTLDENTSVGMGKIICKAKKIQEITQGLILFIHHCGKDAAKGARGHSSLMAAADIAIVITNNGTRNWKVAKNKDGKKDIAGSFNLKEIELGVDEDGEAITSCVIEPCEFFTKNSILTPKEKDSLDALKNLCSKAKTNAILLSEWRNIGAHYIGGNKRSEKTTFDRVCNNLTTKGFIAIDGEIVRLLE